MENTHPVSRSEQAILVGIHIKGSDRRESEQSLDELALLSDTAEVAVCRRFLVSRKSISRTLVIGSGKAEEIREESRRLGVKVIIFDEQLTPLQEKNLQQFFEVKILDRVELILDIFARRAMTHEAKIQIELAQLRYMLPRLTRMWVHLSRQLGGVGVRGPGETQIEIDRRRIREKIHQHKLKLEEIRKIRTTQRQNRSRSEVHRIALVGYTNAGKSTLLNRLTHSHSRVEDKLFCTLDPVTRRLELPDRHEIILTDTVGFINKLPHFLIEAFKATLEEVNESELLLHVLDGSAPSLERNIRAVNRVLFEELLIRDKEIRLVINKNDRLPPERRAELQKQYPEAVFISAATGEGIGTLMQCIEQFIERRTRVVCFFFPMNRLHSAHELREAAVVLSEKFTPDGVRLKARVDAKIHGMLKQYEIESADFA
jgi:GTP-binding protein HflX